MALLQALKAKYLPQTFGDLAEIVLKKIISIAAFNNSQCVDFVTDRYSEVSTKNVERMSRATSATHVFSILGEQQKVPKQWKKFMQVGSNKERLTDFLMEQWRKVPSSSLRSVELFVSNEDKCFKIHSVSNVGMVIEDIRELKCDHEEADTRMFVHPDTDVFVIALATQPSIDAKLIFARYFVILWCKAGIGFHIFTGKHIGSDNTFEQSYKGLSTKSF